MRRVGDLCSLDNTLLHPYTRSSRQTCTDMLGMSARDTIGVGMYELIILSLLMRFPLHGYLIAQIANDMIGPWAGSATGRCTRC